MIEIIQKAIKLSVFAVVSAGIISCGEKKTSQSQTTSQINFSEEAPPIVLFLAGNASCNKTDYLDLSKLSNKPLYLDAFRMIQPVEEAFNKKFQWIMGCYDLDRQLYYKTSDDPFTTYEATTNEFLSVVDYMWKKTPESKGLIVSHSYGAWLGLQVAGRLNRKFHGIYTIDPVNRDKCRILRPFQCRYPGSNLGLSKRLLKQVRKNSESWLNFYQDSDLVIRSNSLDYANKNSKHSELTHRNIDEYQPVWTDIKWNFYNNIYRR